MLRCLTGIVEWGAWQSRITALKSPAARNPIWEPFVLERYGLELAFEAARQHQRATGRCAWPPRDTQEYQLYSFAAAVVRVYSCLTDDGKARLAGAIRRCLASEAGFGPLAFEMRTAVHLMRRGFDVQFRDLETGEGYDFLATRDTTQIEVECKHVSADLGRQIHRRELYDLGGILRPILSQAIETKGGRFLRVTLQGRLTASREQQQTIAGHIASALSGCPASADDTVCAVAVQEFMIPASPFDKGRQLTLRDVEQFVREVFGVEEAHILVNWSPGRGAVLLHFESRKPDRVLATLYKNLKDDAKRQFSGQRPALLCVHLADLTEMQLRELAEADRVGEGTGLQRAVNLLLHKRPHLYSIALMADGPVELRRGLNGSRVETAVQETGPSYVFSNPQHPRFADLQLREVFFESAG
jgi:hypothetical protein